VSTNAFPFRIEVDFGSDWLAQMSGVASVLAGMDMTMPGMFKSSRRNGHFANLVQVMVWFGMTGFPSWVQISPQLL